MPAEFVASTFEHRADERSVALSALLASLSLDDLDRLLQLLRGQVSALRSASSFPVVANTIS